MSTFYDASGIGIPEARDIGIGKCRCIKKGQGQETLPYPFYFDQWQKPLVYPDIKCAGHTH